MASTFHIIDESSAILIATRFLEQHYSILWITVELEEAWWLVTAQVGFMSGQIKKVRIDANTGKIMQCA